MNKKIYSYFIFVMVVSVITSIIFPKISYANQLQVTGNSSQDAIITDSQGNIISHDVSLSEWTNYQVTYHWKVNNSEDVKPGDTIIFTLPDNVQVWTPLDFSVTFKGNVVGTFKIDKGSKIGTLTFNDYIQKHDLTNIEGELNITVVGMHDSATVPGWKINKSGWVGQDNNPTWNIAMNPSGETLGDVEVTDVMSNNQEYVNNSAIIQYGHYDDKGQFIVERVDTHPVVIKDGNKLIFKVPNVHQTFQIRYQTKSTVSQGTLSNVATLTGNKIKGQYTSSAQIKYYGKGDIEGDYPNHSTTISQSHNIVSESKTSYTLESSKSINSVNKETKPIEKSNPINSSPEIINSNSSQTSKSIIYKNSNNITPSSTIKDSNVINKQFKNECHLTRADSKNKKNIVIINNQHTNNMSNNNDNKLEKNSLNKKHEKTSNKKLPQTNDKVDYNFIILGSIMILISSWLYMNKRI